MHGLVSLLPSPYYEEVEALWQELEFDHGLQGIRVTPYPHFSWQVGDNYDFDRLEATINHIANQTAPFTVRTTGLAFFTGVKPVIHIPVVKDETLLSLHTKIWAQTQTLSQGLSPYYNPLHWMPHISLAYEDVTEENVGAVIEKFAFRQFNWEMTLDNIALIYEPEGEIGTLKFHISLKGKP